MKKLIKSLVVLTLSFFSFILIGCETTHTHKWENEVITKEVTCSENGEKTLKCNECGEVKVEIIEALGHLEVIDAGVNPTCTSTGLTEGKHCERCAEVLVAQEEVAALGHDEVIDEAKEATCTTTGLTEGSHCARCSEVLVAQEEVASLGHNYESVVTEPTCVEQGYTTHTCSRCDDSYVDSYVEALGHIEVVDKAVEPTCTETGLTEGSHCDRCNVVLVAQNVIPALGHIEVVDKAVEPTCTETGLTEGKHCDRCKEVLIAQEEVAALGHVEVVDKAVEPTCTKTGLTEGSHCDRCKEVLVAQEEVAVLGHDYDSVVTDPTCVDKGYTTHTCSRCDDTYIDSYVEELGHSYGEWVVTVEPGCESTGMKLRYCKECDHFEEEEISALGHIEIIDKAVAATCTETGLTEGKHCGRCNNILLEQKFIPITHNYKDFVCSICGYNYYTNGLEFVLIENDYYEVYIGNVVDKIVVIPAIYNGLVVKGLTNADLFNDNSNKPIMEIILPTTLEYIGTASLRGCVHVEKIIIPNGVREIGIFAFDRCSSLKEVYIPSSVSYIGTSAFDACISIEKMVVSEHNTVYDSRNNCNAIIETATNTLISGCNNTIIPDDIEIIGRGAFASRSTLTSIIIPEGVYKIDDWAFYLCESLETIVIPKSVTYIGESVFNYRSSLSIYYKGSEYEWNSNVFLGESLDYYNIYFDYEG